jgi:peptidoglycan-associated lipoprotein
VAALTRIGAFWDAVLAALRITPVIALRRGETEMRKCGILTSIILFLSSMLVAQIGGARPAGSENGTRATVFGGYSYLRNGNNRFNGWEGQGTFNFNRHLGVTADVSGASLTPFGFSVLGVSAGTYQRLNNYLFGPAVTANLGRTSVFAHALFGEARSSLGAGVTLPIIGGISTGITSANAFAMAFGGGIDIGLTRHLGIRAVQVDYLRTQFNATDALTTGLSSSLGNRQNSFRYSTGIVFRF